MSDGGGIDWTVLLGGSGGVTGGALLMFQKLVLAPLKGDIDQIKDDVSDLKESCDELKERHAALQIHAATTFVTKGDLQDIFRREIDPIAKSIDKMGDAIDALRNDLKDLERDVR